ncbi:MAG: hypothetical protein U0232_34320, partial [Thermomicrobiales bacterium]
DRATSIVEAFRRDATGAFVPWQADSQGQLWSEVLGLFLVTRGTYLHPQTREGRLLLTPDQAAEELRRVKEEVERLRSELERYRDAN